MSAAPHDESEPHVTANVDEVSQLLLALNRGRQTFSLFYVLQALPTKMPTGIWADHTLELALKYKQPKKV